MDHYEAILKARKKFPRAENWWVKAVSEDYVFFACFLCGKLFHSESRIAGKRLGSASARAVLRHARKHGISFRTVGELCRKRLAVEQERELALTGEKP